MTDWRKLAARVRGELDRADLPERQRRVVEILVKATLMRGRLSVRVPRLDVFSTVLKISRGNLSEIFRALELARICQVTALADGGAEYTLLVDVETWDVVWKYDREELQRFLQDLDQWSGQVQGELLPPEPSLARAVAESGLDNMRSRIGNHLPAAVPDSGTPVKRLEGFNSSNFKALKLEGFERFNAAVADIQSSSETDAMSGCRELLGEKVMANDGGKWRLRWRSQQGKVARVFAALAEDTKAGRVRNAGAHAEDLWKRF